MSNLKTLKYPIFAKKHIKMKKISIIILALATTIQVAAQSKVGTIDIDYIISNMPQLEQLNEDVKTYGADLDNQLQVKVTKYKALISVYEQSESTYSEEDKKTKQDEIIALEQDIQNFQKNGASLVQIHRNELLNPLYKLIGEALNTVAAEGKFTQILTITNSIAYLDPNFDITLLTMTKMGITIPAQE